MLRPGGQTYGVVVYSLARGHLLGHSLGIGHHILRSLGRMPAVEGLGAEYLRWRIGLAILDVALVARRKHRHLLLAQYPCEVVIHIACIVERVGHHHCRHLARRQPAEHHRRGRPCEVVHRDYACASRKRLAECLTAWRGEKSVAEFL